MLEPVLIEVAARHCGAHRAAGFAPVRAIAEPALLGQRLDVGERLAEALVRIPEGHRAQTRRVDEHATARQHDQFPRSRRVAPALIALADVAGVLHVGADQPVDQRRLPHSGRADERDRPADPGVPMQVVDAFAVDRARDDDVHARRDAEHRGLGVLALRHEVALRQHHDRGRAAVVHEHQLPFEPAEVRPVRQRLHDEHRVDVRGDDLRATRRAVHRIAAHELGRSRQDRRDREAFAFVGVVLDDEHPVARGHGAGSRNRTDETVLGDHRHQPAVDARHPARARARLRRVRGECREPFGPAQRVQCRGFAVHPAPSLPPCRPPARRWRGDRRPPA